MGGLSLVGLALAAGVSAQELPPKGVFPGSRPLPLPSAPESPKPVPLELPPPPPSRAGALPGDLRFFLREVAIEGNSVLPAAVLAEVTAPYVGREVDGGDLESLRDALTGLYVQSGYVNSRATLPDQDLAGGLLRVRIVEGHLDEVVIRGNRGYRASTLRAQLLGDSKRPLNAYAIERRLRALEAEPGIESLQAALRPGVSRERSVLDVQVVEGRRLSAGLDFGNEFNPLIGAEGGHLGLSYLNPLGIGDVLAATFGVSEGLRDVRAEYATPLGRYGTRLQLDFRYSRAKIVEPDLEFLDIESRYMDAAIDLSQRLWVGERSQLVAGLRAAWRQSRSTYLFGSFSFSDAANDDGRVRDSVLRFYQEWSTRSANQAFVARSTWSVGLDVLGATSGPVDTAEFAAWLGQLQWLRRFEKSGLEVLLRGSAQLALDPLLPFERFSVGGYYSVRGYRENELVRDNGFSFGLDVRLPLRRTPAGRTLLRAGPFVDVGRSWNQERGVTRGEKTLASVGVAVAWWPWPWLRAEFSYGARLVDVDRPNESSLQDHGIDFRLFATAW